jgi:hypothetical protein
MAILFNEAELAFSGWLFASPGKVLAMSSVPLEKPSPSVSLLSIAASAAEERPAD